VYLWLVAVHLLGLILFVMCHGVSMFVAFRIRRETNRDLIAAFLALSNRATQAMYLGLLLLGVGGVAAAWVNGWLTASWVVASYVVLVVTLLVMWAVGAGYYYPLRDGLEGTEKTPRLDDAALARTLSTSRRPEILAATGLAALAILVWLMVLKPGA
jgi:uncharacterized membrane protein